MLCCCDCCIRVSRSSCIASGYSCRRLSIRLIPSFYVLQWWISFGAMDSHCQEHSCSTAILQFKENSSCEFRIHLTARTIITRLYVYKYKEKSVILQAIGIIQLKSKETRVVAYTRRYSSGYLIPM